MEILVSVIIPFYNSENTLSRAILSVLNQTYKNIEIICVNNNSNDRSLDLVIELQKKFPNKIKVLHENVQGAPLARNRGIQNAQGSWIQFLDADDELLDVKIEKQVAQLTNNLCDILVANFIVKDDNIIKIDFIQQNCWIALIRGRLGCTCSNLFFKDKLLEIGGWDNIQSSQETMLMFKILKSKANLLFDFEYNSIVHKKDNINSISKIDPTKNIIRYVDLRFKIWDFLLDSNQISTEIEIALKSTIFNMVQILFNFDKSSAIYLHQNFIVNKFKPIKDNNNSAVYLFFYSLFGFNTTQNIKVYLFDIYNKTLKKKFFKK